MLVKYIIYVWRNIFRNILNYMCDLDPFSKILSHMTHKMPTYMLPTVQYDRQYGIVRAMKEWAWPVIKYNLKSA